MLYCYGSRPQEPAVETPDINIELPETPEVIENNTVIENPQDTEPSRPGIELPDIEVDVSMPNNNTESAPQGEAAPAEQPEPAAEPEPESSQ